MLLIMKIKFSITLVLFKTKIKRLPHAHYNGYYRRWWGEVLVRTGRRGNPCVLLGRNVKWCSWNGANCGKQDGKS